MALVACAYAAQATQKPGITGDPMPLPESLEGVVRTAPIILRRTVTTVAVDTIRTDTGAGVLVVRRATLRVSDVAKGDAIQVGQVVDVLQSGGSATVDGKEVSSPYDDNVRRLLAPGDDVIVAVIDWPVAKGFGVLFGSAGIFDVRAGRVTGNAAGRDMARSGGMPQSVRDFVTRVKLLSRGRDDAARQPKVDSEDDQT
jgi:hypothetical protein